MHEARHILAKFFVNSVVWTVLCENVGWQNILPKAEVRITKRFDWHYYMSLEVRQCFLQTPYTPV